MADADLAAALKAIQAQLDNQAAKLDNRAAQLDKHAIVVHQTLQQHMTSVDSRLAELKSQFIEYGSPAMCTVEPHPCSSVPRALPPQRVSNPNLYYAHDLHLRCSMEVLAENQKQFSKMRTIISENQKQLNKLFEQCFAIVDDGARDAHPHVSASEQSDNADPDADVLSGLKLVEDENGLNADNDETNVVVLEEDIESAESKNRHINKIAPELFDENPKKNSDILLEVKKVGSSHEWGNDCTVDDSVHDTCKVDLEGSELVYGSRIVLTFGAFPRVKLKFNVLFEVIALIRSNGICSSDHANEKGFTDFAIILKEGDISSLNTLADQGNPRSLHIIGEINKQSVQVFIDSGSTHNLIKPGVAELLGLNVQPTSSFRVNIGNGDSLVCQFFCPSVALTLQTHVFFIDLYVLPSEGPDVILGIQWLQLLGKVFHDYDALTMEFMWHGASILLRGDTSLCFRKISFNQFQALLSHDTVLCANKITTGLKIIIKYSNHGSVDHKLVDKNPNKAVPMFWTAIDAGTSSAMVTPHLFNIIQCLVETAAYKTLNNADEKMMEYGNQQRRSIF